MKKKHINLLVIILTVILFSCFERATNVNTSGIARASKDTTIIAGETLKLWVKAYNPQEVKEYMWDFDGNGNWDDSTTKDTAIFFKTDSGVYQVGVAIKNTLGAILPKYTIIVTVLDSNKIEFDVSWEYLRAFLIFQDSLPKNPYIYTNPTDLFKSVHEPYTVYFSPEYANYFLSLLTTKTAGMGVVLDSVYNGIYIRFVIDNAPAKLAGVLKGDTIISVDDSVLAGRSIGGASELIRGEIGQLRNLIIKRDTQEVKITVTLGEFMAPSVFTDSIDSDIAYLWVTEFSTPTSDPLGTASEFRLALTNTKWAKYTILDLRGNGGGYVDQCLEMISEFVPKGSSVANFHQRKYVPIDANSFNVYTQDSVYITPLVGSNLDRKLIILADTFSASASELMISALRDQKNFKVVGRKTYGKARGQIIPSTPLGGLAKITFSTIKPIKSPNYDMIGIVPDYETATSKEALVKGIEVAHSLISGVPKISASGMAKVKSIEAMKEQFTKTWRGPLCIMNSELLNNKKNLNK